MSGQARRPVPDGPYETEEQARADVTKILGKARNSMRRDALPEGNRIYLADACERAEVVLGAFDARILAWLANYEPETCAAIAGLISRAYCATKASTLNA